jgi:Ni/Co efflux regulator RcnB
MKMLRVLLAMAAVAALTTSVASADPNTPRVDRREWRQHERIQQGVRSGELTRGEAWRLRQGNGRVQRVERRARFDGVVTPRERVRMDRVQDRQGRRLHRLRHNRREI